MIELEKLLFYNYYVIIDVGENYYGCQYWWMKV